MDGNPKIRDSRIPGAGDSAERREEEVVDDADEQVCEDDGGNDEEEIVGEPGGSELNSEGHCTEFKQDRREYPKIACGRCRIPWSGKGKSGGRGRKGWGRSTAAVYYIYVFSETAYQSPSSNVCLCGCQSRCKMSDATPVMVSKAQQFDFNLRCT